MPKAMPASIRCSRRAGSSRRPAGRMCGESSSTSMPPIRHAHHRGARPHWSALWHRGHYPRLPPDERRTHPSREKAAPLLAALRAWLDTTLPKFSAKSDLARAMRYTLGRWATLNRYADDGRIEIDNNAAERSIRGIALGRKNWLFAGSDTGGERAAAVYSLIATCKLNGIDPKPISALSSPKSLIIDQSRGRTAPVELGKQPTPRRSRIDHRTLTSIPRAMQLHRTVSCTNDLAYATCQALRSLRTSASSAPPPLQSHDPQTGLGRKQYTLSRPNFDLV